MNFSLILFVFCFQVSDRQAMHILMATIDALDVDADGVVLNRTSLQQMRENNRHYNSVEEKSELIEQVINLKIKLNKCYF